jgi:serpin B
MKRMLVVVVVIMAFSLGRADQPAAYVPTSDLCRGINAFTVDYMKQMTADSGNNAVVSGYGIFENVAGVYIASGGQTRSELAKALHFPDSNDVLAEQLQGLRQELEKAGSKPKVKMQIANSMWMDHAHVHFRPEYVANVRKWFGVDVHEAAFVNSRQASDQINSWIAEKTSGRIEKGVSPSDLASRSMPLLGILDEPAIVSVNTTWFKAEWQTRFNKSDTSFYPFHTTANVAKDRLMMHQFPVVPYAEDETFQFVELPYAEGTYSMYVILPREVLTPEEMLGKISPETISGLRDRAFHCRVDVLLPKFEIRTRSMAKDILARMGTSAVWDKRRADLGGMFLEDSHAQHIYLSEIYNDSWIQTDEEGTEAASVTSTINLSFFECSAPMQEMPAVFHADHPFVFMIVHKDSRTVVFSGWVGDPNWQ